MVEKVTDPQKITTDAEVLRNLDRLGIDKDYVEFWQDYAPRSLGKEHSPYAKFYRDLKSGKKFMVVSGLPKVNADGVKIGGDAHNQPRIGWNEVEEGVKYTLKVNIFGGEVDGGKVELVNLNDQPTGTKKGDTIEWEPQLFLNSVEQTCGDAILLATDPTNQFYHDNVLEWDYGICKRRLRVIEGRCRERWIFTQDPQGEVRIKHNKTGAIRLKLGGYRINDDEELIPASAFAEAVFPLEIGASPETFYPDAGVASVDGAVSHFDAGGLTWANMIIAAGSGSNDTSDGSDLGLMTIRGDGNNNEFDILYKSIFLFNTEPLPDDEEVTDVTFSIYGYGKEDVLSVTPDINVYASTPFSNTALQNDDFVDIASTPFCDTPITYGNWKTGDPFWNDFVFNPAGKSAISKTGITKLGTRNANYDVSTTPPTWSEEISRLRGYYTEKGTGFKPKLVVAYAPVAAAAPGGSPANLLIAQGML